MRHGPERLQWYRGLRRRLRHGADVRRRNGLPVPLGPDTLRNDLRRYPFELEPLRLLQCMRDFRTEVLVRIVCSMHYRRRLRGRWLELRREPCVRVPAAERHEPSRQCRLRKLLGRFCVDDQCGRDMGFR